jgi:hypothetical protein
MSIAATLLQFLTVAALRDATLAGSEIIGTPVDPLSSDFQGVAKPTIAVFTGEDRRTEIKARDLLGANREIELSIQVHCPDQVGIEVDGQPVRVDTRGQGGDLVVDMISRQIERALLAADTPASVLWRELVPQIRSVVSAPYLFEVQDRVRIFVSETSFVCETLSDPSFGAEELSPFWQRAVDALKTDADYGPIGSWLEAEIMSPLGRPEYRVQQADLGLTAPELRGIGLGPVVVSDPPEAYEDIPGTVEITTGEHVLDEEAAAEADPPAP